MNSGRKIIFTLAILLPLLAPAFCWAESSPGDKPTPFIVEAPPPESEIPLRWTVFTSGTPLVETSEAKVVVTVPGPCVEDDWNGGLKAAGLISGDFDIQVDYSLDVWPPRNGIRVGIVTGPWGRPGYTVQRVGLVNKADPIDTPEVYLMDAAGIQRPYPQIPTLDLKGTLRLTRTKGTFCALYRDSLTGDWIRIETIRGSDSALPLHLVIWSNRGLFSGTRAQVSFSNFRINKGRIIRAQDSVRDVVY